MLPNELIQFSIALLSIPMIGIGVAGLLWCLDRIAGICEERRGV